MRIEPYIHDCTDCVWVGWIHIQGGGKWGSNWGNMYLHGQGGRQSVVIRFSDEPSDYWSASVGGCERGALGGITVCWDNASPDDGIAEGGA